MEIRNIHLANSNNERLTNPGMVIKVHKEVNKTSTKLWTRISESHGQSLSCEFNTDIFIISESFDIVDKILLVWKNSDGGKVFSKPLSNERQLSEIFSCQLSKYCWTSNNHITNRWIYFAMYLPSSKFATDSGQYRYVVGDRYVPVLRLQVFRQTNSIVLSLKKPDFLVVGFKRVNDSFQLSQREHAHIWAIIHPAQSPPSSSCRRSCFKDGVCEGQSPRGPQYSAFGALSFYAICSLSR